MKKKQFMPNFRFQGQGTAAICILATLLVVLQGTAFAGGAFGPPQPFSRESGGLATAAAYWRNEAQVEDGNDHSVRQNQGYSEAGYGTKHWALFGRIGITDLTISDAFRPRQPYTTTFKSDFEDSWEWFGTLGVKGYLPFNGTFGLGAFLQGSYYFNDFIDKVSGSQNGVPFEAQFKVSRFWEVQIGLGFQAIIPTDIKLYIGPYLGFSEATVSQSRIVSGLGSPTGSYLIQNRSGLGGFGGVALPLTRGFHLNVEGHYAEKFSLGAAIIYSY